MRTARLAAAAGGAGAAAAFPAGLVLAARAAVRRFESLDLDRTPLPGSRFWVNGVAVHYVERGNGFPLVLIPGWCASAFTYRLVIEPLAARCRVIALDLPGFGFSERSPDHTYSTTTASATLREFLRRIGARPAAIVGHSFGGAVAQRIAVEAPELVERLVLVDAISAAEPATTPRLAPNAVLALLLQGLISLRPSLLRRSLRHTVADPSFITDAELAGYLTPLRVPGSAAVLRRMIADVKQDRALDLNQIAAPTLIVQGAEDRLVPPATATRLNEAIRGSRLVTVAGAGHLVPEEQPRRFVRLVEQFLADLPAGRAEPVAPRERQA